MASYCSKCGVEVSPDAQACAACGTPIVAAVAVPVAQPAAALPPKSSNSALKIILIILAVVIGLGVLGLGAVGFFVWRVAHSVHVSGNGKDVTLNTPGGTFSTSTSVTYTADELGTDIYPGASSGKGSMRMSLPTGSVVTGIFVTGDSKDQVMNYYKSKLGSEASVFDSGDATVLTLPKGDKESVVVTITKGSSEDNGKTQITIVHTITKS